ncbi:MAG: hypothetical protein H7831_14085 [Magnetococcus sp. WYHC-3]
MGMRCLLVVLALLAGLLPASSWAFFSELRYSTEDRGRREVLQMEIPSLGQIPELSQNGPRSLLLKLPGVLALPIDALDYQATRYIDGFDVSELPGSIGLQVIIRLKEPFLNFRDRVIPPKTGQETTENGRNGQHPTYQLLIERAVDPTGKGTTELMDSRIFPGRDATLVVFDHAGDSAVDKAVNIDARIVQLRFNKARIGDTWRLPEPAGLAEHLVAYPFPRTETVEVEISLHSRADQVQFYRDAAAGLYIVEIRPQDGVEGGRGSEIQTMVDARRESLAKGQAFPLSRFSPFFQLTDASVELNKEVVTEEHFWFKALHAQADHQYGKAYAYLNSFLRLFPDSPNRELVDFLRVDLAQQMGWKPGWVLSVLADAMARHPNSHFYPRYRLLEFQLLNQAGLYEAAAAFLDEPNLPKRDPRVLLEKAHTTLAVERTDEARDYLLRVLGSDRGDDRSRAEAALLLATLANRDHDDEAVQKYLGDMTRGQRGYLSDRPDWLLEAGTLLTGIKQYAMAIPFYGDILNQYPTDEKYAPWAILRTAQCYRWLEEPETTRELLQRLDKEWPGTEPQLWGQVLALEIDHERPLEERIAALDALIAKSPMSEGVIEAHMVKSIFLGQAQRHRDAIDSLNTLLRLTSRESVMQRADQLKRQYLEAGMQSALDRAQPEQAMVLAQIHGENWTTQAGYDAARLQLAEALMRLGMFDTVADLLKRCDAALAAPFQELLSRLQSGAPLPESLPSPALPALARIQVDRALNAQSRSAWTEVLSLLTELDPALLGQEDSHKRLRAIARAQAGLRRYPQAANAMEKLLEGIDMGSGADMYWYAMLQQVWKGDDKADAIYAKVAEEGSDKEIQALAHLRIGDILQRKGDNAAAQRRYAQARDLVPASTWGAISQENVSQLDLVK